MILVSLLQPRILYDSMTSSKCHLYAFLTIFHLLGKSLMCFKYHISKDLCKSTCIIKHKKSSCEKAYQYIQILFY